MDFDDLLPILGGFGRYQIILFCALLIPANFPSSFVMLSFIFVSATPDHWCKVPELEKYRLPLNVIKNVSIPLEEKDGKLQHSRCKMYDVNYTKVALDFMINNVSSSNHSWPVTNCKFGWNYDKSIYHNTLTTKWDVVCDEDWKTALANSMYFAGVVTSQLTLGYVGDKFGRKLCLFIILTAVILLGLISCFPPNYTAYIVYRGFVGFTVASLYLIFIILLTEFTVPNKRSTIGMICGIFYSVGLIVFTGIAYLLRDWFYISLMYCVPFIPFLGLWWFVPESPRWLISQNRIEEAEAVVQKIAKVNKKTIEKDFLKTFLQLNKNPNCKNTSCKSFPYFELFKYPNMRCRQLILCLEWAILAVVYSVLVFNAMNMKINIYLASITNSFAEIPGDLIIMVAMDVIGRRLSLFFSMGIAGLGCLSAMCFPPDYVWTIVILANIGKAGNAAAFCMIFVYGCELFPTSLRQSALSLPIFCAGLAGISSPFVLYLSKYQRILPLTIAGILCVIAALAALILPETLNAHLPQTIEDGENMGLNNICLFWKRRNYEDPKETKK